MTPYIEIEEYEDWLEIYVGGDLLFEGTALDADQLTVILDAIGVEYGHQTREYRVQEDE